MSRARIECLRDKLIGRGYPSVAPAGSNSRPREQPSAAALYERLRPIAEAMYLVMSADAQIADSERAALRGALRMLTDGVVSSAAMETMLEQFDTALARDGLELRLDAVASELYGDADDVELALALVEAAALADGSAGAAERRTIEALAERLEVSPQRLHDITDLS